MDNSPAKDILEKSWVHNSFIKPSEIFLFTNKKKKSHKSHSTQAAQPSESA